MSEEVQQQIAQEVPDSAVIVEPAVTPEVADQETSEVAEEAKETVEQRADRLEKESHAKQKRIDRLTADKYRTQGENQALRARQEQIEVALRQQMSPEEQRQLTPQDVEQRAKQLAQQHVAQERFDAKCADFVEKGSKEIKGFEEKVKVVAAEVALFDHRNAPTPFLDQLLQCDSPQKVLAYLSENPDDAADFAHLPPARIARRLAQIEGSILAAPKVSKAPEPVKPIGSRGSGAQKSPEQESMAEYIARRTKEGARWAK